MNTDKCRGKFLFRKSERGHSEYKGLDRNANIKTDVKGNKYLDRIHLAQNRKKWTLPNTAMNPPVPKNA
jgi:hypothetical protein